MGDHLDRPPRNREQGAPATASDWRKTTLGTVADFISGGTPSKSRPDYWGGSIPWVSAKEMKHLQLHETADKITTVGLANGTRMVPANTVMILVRGMTLLNDVPVCITQRPMTFNQDVKALRPKSGVAEEFLPYLVLGKKDRLLGMVDLAGHGTGRLNTEELKAIDIDLPPLSEQRAIAHILGTLDDKIELNRRMNGTLEEMARALFKSWFVDFDLVRAKAALKQHALRHQSPIAGEPSGNRASPAGEWTVERARAYLAGTDPNIVDPFPDRLVPSEVCDIPEGWEVGLFGDVVAQVRDSENPLMSPDTLFSHYSIPAYDEGQTAKRELGESIKSVKARVLPGVVLLSKLNPEIERVWLPDTGTGERAICSTEFLVLQSKPPFHRAYVYCLARSAVFQQRLRSLVTGTSKSHQRAPAGAVLSLQAILPCAAVVKVFLQQASTLLSGSRRCRRENVALAAQRDALLPKLVSGNIRLRDAAKQAEAVA